MHFLRVFFCVFLYMLSKNVHFICKVRTVVQSEHILAAAGLELGLVKVQVFGEVLENDSVNSMEEECKY